MIPFILEYGGEAQVWIGYKEQNQAHPRRFKSVNYFHTEWLPEKILTLNLEGLTMDELAGDRQVEK